MGDITFNRTQGQKKVSRAEITEVKADAAIAEIVADNAVIDADLAAIDAATQAQVKEMVKRLLQGLKRSNNRQRKIIVYLKGQL